MTKNIFYSWQSDLPSNQNRGFIQQCLETAIVEIKAHPFHLEVAIDRDTIGLAGTPDIASAIFEKIDAASVFVADVSIINSGDEKRKMPNPNVSIELGYAAKALGWNRVITVFNSAFGSVEDLPFDLRFRRPLIYSITNPKNKAKDRRHLSDRIREAVLSVIREQTNKDEIFTYVKKQIDKDILSLCNLLHKLLAGYDEQLSSNNVWQLLSMTQQQVMENLFEKKFIGFTILKDWAENLLHITDSINQSLFTQHAQQVHTAAMVKVVRALEMLISITQQDKLFVDTGKKVIGYDLITGKDLNASNPANRFILSKSLNSVDAVIVDFGDFKPYDQNRLLNYHVIFHQNFNSYAIAIHNLIASIHYWVENSGNSIMIGPSYT
ncbi:MAG: hypothetical protein V4539_16170 [Bacteroidota bacterium]